MRALAGLALFAAITGCASEEVAPIDQGLTVIEADAGYVKVAYRKGEATIYLEAIRGQLSPDIYQKDPAAPAYEVDARMTSEDGRTFFIQRGGDALIESAWGADLERDDATPATGSNEALFAMAAEAAALIDVGLATPGLLPEVGALRAMGEAAPRTFAEIRAQAQPKDTGISYGSEGHGEDPSDNLGEGYYAFQIWRSNIAGDGWHSATRLFKWVDGGWAVAADSCNHGNPSDGGCPSSGMEWVCNDEWYEPVVDYKAAWTMYSCASHYSWTSNDGGHNCHDDTRNQEAGFVYSKSNDGYQAWCADGDADADISHWPGDMGGTPECSGRSDRGYHHPSWCDYNNNSSCPASWQGTQDGCDCGCVFPDGTSADPDCAAR